MSDTPMTEQLADHAAGWEAAGRQIAPMLGSYSAAVVTALDPLAAAHVALGIGLAEAEHRRVAIADLVGELEPLQSLVTGDDPHGISDSFTYGVSLNKIARAIDTTGNLFVMPSGTGSVSDPEIFKNARWQRLANGFREVGALLLLVAPADAPALQELVDQVDGVVLVGTSPLDLMPYLNVLARVPAPLRPPQPRRPKRNLPVMQLAGLLVVLLALVGAGVYMRYARGAKQRPAVRRPALGAAARPATPAPGTAAPADTFIVPPPSNPQDSAIAAAYAVELGASNAVDDATLELQRRKEPLPAATISPVPIQPSREVYYKVIVGAFGSRRTAETLLATIRRTQPPTVGPGTVVRTPYALLIDSAPPGRTQDLVRKYAGSAQALYVLEQPDRGLKLYAGAFERPEDAYMLMAALRAAKLNPTLVYRTGRAP